jgi:hypothetical protein
MRKFASRDPALKRLLEEHLRFGRELKSSRTDKGLAKMLEEAEAEADDGEGQGNRSLTTEEIVKVCNWSIDIITNVKKSQKKLCIHIKSKNIYKLYYLEFFMEFINKKKMWFWFLFKKYLNFKLHKYIVTPDNG